MHTTITLERIARLYDAAGELLARSEELSDADRRRFDAIREELDQLWPKRRAEIVLQTSGPPRFLGSADPRHRGPRLQAFGIAPLLSREVGQ